MTIRQKISIVGIGVIIAFLLVENFGASWGLTAAHLETTKGLAMGLLAGLLVWYLFAWWKGSSKAD